MAEMNPQIALSGLLINRNDENLKQAQYQRYQAQAQQDQEQQQGRRRLADLIPQAMQGDKAALGQIASIDPQLYMRLDEQQKASVKAQFADMGAAVRWSMQDPAQKAQRWNQVVDHYSQSHPEVAKYRDHPEMAEQALMQLGRLGDYLDSAPKPEYKTIEQGGSLIDVSGGNPHVVIAPNPGGYQTGAPVGGGNVPQAAVDMLRQNPQMKADFDAKYGPGAADRALGGQSQSGSGGFL